MQREKKKHAIIPLWLFQRNQWFFFSNWLIDFKQLVSASNM